MRLPLVSAVIATYNRAHVVGEAINSVLQQTYPNVELIVVDDGSSDNTQEVLRELGPRIRVVVQENSGPSAARNHGIKVARGQIISFLDSDDLWMPTFVERHVALLEKAGPSVPCSISNAWARFADGREDYSFEIAWLRPAIGEGLWVNPFDVLASRFVMCCQMLAIRREIVDKIGGFDNSLKHMEDYDIALRLSLEGPWGFIREPLVLFRQSPPGESLSLSITAEDSKLHECIFKIRQKADALRAARAPAVRSRHMVLALQSARRQVWVASLRNDRSSLKRCLGRLLWRVQRYRSAFWRRSPFFPKMTTVPLRYASRV